MILASEGSHVDPLLSPIWHHASIYIKLKFSIFFEHSIEIPKFRAMHMQWRPPASTFATLPALLGLCIGLDALFHQLKLAAREAPAQMDVPVEGLRVEHRPCERLVLIKIDVGRPLNSKGSCREHLLAARALLVLLSVSSLSSVAARQKVRPSENSVVQSFILLRSRARVHLRRT